jgi:hypothetical protein
MMAYCSESRTRGLTTIIDVLAQPNSRCVLDIAFITHSALQLALAEHHGTGRRDTGRPRLSSEETSASMVDLVIVANIATTLHCEEFLVSHLLSKYCHLLRGLCRLAR